MTGREPHAFRFPTGNGLIVQAVYAMSNDRLLYAEIEPAYSRWLPWRGRTSRWWYEVHAITEADEHGCDVTTYAYMEGGSGGGFTLASCVRKAQRAVDSFAFATGDGE